MENKHNKTNNSIKEDLRIRRTKALLLDTFFSLLNEKHFSKITVSDICLKSMVSRTAFYSHFEDKYSLLDYCFEYIDDYLFGDFDNSQGKDKIKFLLKTIQSNSKIFNNLIISNLDYRLNSIIENRIISAFNKSNKKSDTIPTNLDITFVYHSAGMTSTIIYWVNHSNEHSVDDMTNYIYSLLTKSLSLS